MESDTHEANASSPNSNECSSSDNSDITDSSSSYKNPNKISQRTLGESQKQGGNLDVQSNNQPKQAKQDINKHIKSILKKKTMPLELEPQDKMIENTCQQSEKQKEVDEYDVYGELIARKLRNLNTRYARVTVQVAEEKKSKTKLSKKNKKSKFKVVKNPSGLVSLYVTSCEKDLSPKVTLNQLKGAMPNLDPASSVETDFGLIVNLADDKDVQKILKLDLAKVFGKPVQVVPLFSGHFKKMVSFKDVPWCIRNEELEICLKNQGINFGKLMREKSTVYIELSDFPNYHRLREEGINFYNSVVFPAADDVGLNDDVRYASDNIIQCYRCQGFWHTANTCKQNIRCVRCGEEHSVENCDRPKHSAVCCNCKGPHHAAYKLCPVRLKLKKSVRVSFSYNP